MNAFQVRNQIERYLSGKYVKPVDDFCLYQWVERCTYHGWVELGLNLLSVVNVEILEKPYRDRIQYLAADLRAKGSEPQKKPRAGTDVRNSHGRRRKAGERTPQIHFRSVIIDVLKISGGRSRVRDVAVLVEQKMRYRFTEADMEASSCGSTVWYNTMCWERQSMVSDGVLRNDSPHGIWELADH